MSDTDKVLEYLIDAGDSLLEDIQSNAMEPPPGLIEIYEAQLYDEFVAGVSQATGVDYVVVLETIDTLVEVA